MDWEGVVVAKAGASLAYASGSEWGGRVAGEASLCVREVRDAASGGGGGARLLG